MKDEIEDIDDIDLAEAKRRLVRLAKSIDTVYPICDAPAWSACDVQDYLMDLMDILDGDVW